MSDALRNEADRASRLLSGKTVRSVVRRNTTELRVEFTDASRLFINTEISPLELSITLGE